MQHQDSEPVEMIEPGRQAQYEQHERIFYPPLQKPGLFQSWWTVAVLAIVGITVAGLLIWLTHDYIVNWLLPGEIWIDTDRP